MNGSRWPTFRTAPSRLVPPFICRGGLAGSSGFVADPETKVAVLLLCVCQQLFGENELMVEVHPALEQRISPAIWYLWPLILCSVAYQTEGVAQAQGGKEPETYNQQRCEFTRPPRTLEWDGSCAITHRRNARCKCCHLCSIGKVSARLVCRNVTPVIPSFWLRKIPKPWDCASCQRKSCLIQAFG